MKYVFFTLCVLFCCGVSNAQIFEKINNPQDFVSIGSGYSGNPISWNSSHYFKLKNNEGVFKLYSLDKGDLNLVSGQETITSRDAGYQGSPIVFNNKLYLQYQENSGVFFLYKLDDDGIKKIHNPSSNFDNSGSGYIGDPFILNDKLYLRYQNDENFYQLFEYDGNNLKLVENAPFGNRFYQESGYYGEVLVFNEKAFLRYRNNTSNYRLVIFDGLTFTTIENPANYGAANCGYLGLPFVFKNRLFFNFKPNSGSNQLYELNQNSLIPISHPQGHTAYNSMGYVKDDYYKNRTTPIEFNGKMYIKYANSTNQYNLVAFDGNTLSIISNPTSLFSAYKGYIGEPIVYKNKLFFRYRNNNNLYHLYYFDGTNLNLIPSPEEFTSNLGPYKGSPFIFDGTLYFGYGAGTSRLYKLNEQEIPVEVVPDLNWGGKSQTFISPDGLFTGFWSTPSYISNLYFYKKETITSVEFVAREYLKVYPNPSNGILNVSISNIPKQASIQIFDLHYKLVYTRNIDQLNTGLSNINIDLKHLKSGFYTLRYISNNEVLNHKFIIK
jgi:hypothetical protein